MAAPLRKINSISIGTPRIAILTFMVTKPGIVNIMCLETICKEEGKQRRIFICDSAIYSTIKITFSLAPKLQLIMYLIMKMHTEEKKNYHV